jgi:hypothetical protein
MKKTLFFLMLTLAIVPAQLVSQSIDLNSARQNYLVGLRSENTGVVESAIYNVLHLVKADPSQPIDEIRKQLTSLSTTADANRVRYKAGVALLLLAQPEILNSMTYDRSVTADQYFAEAMERMTATYLVVNPQTTH